MSIDPAGRVDITGSLFVNGTPKSLDVMALEHERELAIKDKVINKLLAKVEKIELILEAKGDLDKRESIDIEAITKAVETKIKDLQEKHNKVLVQEEEEHEKMLKEQEVSYKEEIDKLEKKVK